MFARTQKSLGTPVPPRQLFTALNINLSERVHFFGLADREKLVAGMVCLTFNDQLHSMYAATEHSYQREYANYLLYLRVIEWALDEHIALFNMGRSKAGNRPSRLQTEMAERRSRRRLLPRSTGETGLGEGDFRHQPRAQRPGNALAPVAVMGGQLAGPDLAPEITLRVIPACAASTSIPLHLRSATINTHDASAQRRRELSTCGERVSGHSAGLPSTRVMAKPARSRSAFSRSSSGQ